MSVLAPERPLVRAVGDEPLPGYRLIAPLGQGGYGEVWKCIAPGGLHKAIKFVYEDPARPGNGDSLHQEYEAFERIKGIRHPFLLSLERVELNGGELITVMELADQNLVQCFDEHEAAGLPGIPRDILLSYMVDTAEVLDVLARQHQLQHLDIKPANVFLLGGHAKVGDYGLVSRLQLGSAFDEPELERGLTPRYVAPEILNGRVDIRSDQYSLALMYQELLTGKFPYNGRSVRQLLSQHTSGEPDLSPLPTNDREAVRRALAKDPAQRFPTCLAFVKGIMREELSKAGQRPASKPTPSLISSNLNRTPPPAARISSTKKFNPYATLRLVGVIGTTQPVAAVAVLPAAQEKKPVARQAVGVVLDEIRSIESAARLKGGPVGSVPEPHEFIEVLLRAAGADRVVAWPSPDSALLVCRVEDGRLTTRFAVTFSQELTELKVAAFCKEMGYDLLFSTGDCAILKPRGANGVELSVKYPSGSQARSGEIEVAGRAVRQRDAAKATDLVIAAMEQFHRALANAPERRRSPRFHTKWPVSFYSIDDELSVATPVHASCADVSAEGFRCVLEAPLPGEHAYLHFAGVTGLEGAAALIRIHRSTTDADGKLQIAGRFVFAG